MSRRAGLGIVRAFETAVATESRIMNRRTIKLEMNRVEGDVEIRLEVEGHS
jgi:hypothetical protein